MINQKSLQQIHELQLTITTLGETIQHLEKRIKGINLWIHKLQENGSNLETRLYKIEHKLIEWDETIGRQQ